MKGHVNTKNGEISIENQVIAKMYRENIMTCVDEKRIFQYTIFNLDVLGK